MGLWTLLEGFLLLANALAILNEERFLAPRGWSFSEVSTSGGAKTLKGQIIGLIYAAQYLRVPLIVLNAITILVKLISGWSFFFLISLPPPLSPLFVLFLFPVLESLKCSRHDIFAFWSVFCWILNVTCNSFGLLGFLLSDSTWW